MSNFCHWFNNVVADLERLMCSPVVCRFLSWKIDLSTPKLFPNQPWFLRGCTPTFCKASLCNWTTDTYYSSLWTRPTSLHVFSFAFVSLFVELLLLLLLLCFVCVCVCFCVWFFFLFFFFWGGGGPIQRFVVVVVLVFFSWKKYKLFYKAPNNNFKSF